MSRENVEVVRRAYAEFERGNFWVPEFFDPSVRIVWLEPLAAGEPESVGLQGLSRGIKEWMGSWQRVTLTAERVIDAGDRVVVVAVWRGSGKASGVATEWRHGQVWTLREGKATSVTTYRDPADALEAVGLTGQT